MSKMLDASIKCPNCGHEQTMSLFRSIWAEYADNRKLILNDKVNLFRCKKCTHEERLEFPFLCTNVKRGVAIWYEPYHDQQIDEDAENYRKHMGKDSFYAKAPRIADWEAFKAKFLEMDAAGPQHGQEVTHSMESKEQFKGFVASLKKDDISRAGGRSIGSKTTPKLTAGEFAHLLEEAESGDKDAQYTVGGAYLNGNGVKRDVSLGERWLLAAAGHGQAAAQCDLGALYADGRILKQSYSDALKWLRKAAEQGDALAMAGLGSLYGKGFRDKGIGFFQRVVLANMSVDRVEAYKWFSLALQKGHPAAARDLWLLKRLMSDAQLKEAERKIEEFARERQGSNPPQDTRKLPSATQRRDLDPAVEYMMQVGELLKHGDASSLIYVVAESWLNDLLRDYEYVGENAPKHIKANVIAIRKYVGSEGTCELTTRQYQKFADRFERFLFEHTAPNSELAEVFNFIKGYLEDIYSGLAKFGVSDEIRDWHDSVLSLSSGKIIIAP